MNTCRLIGGWDRFLLSLLLAGGAAASEMSVMRRPPTWQLSQGTGECREMEDGDNLLMVEGSGEDDNCWLSGPLGMRPSTLYQAHYQAWTENAIGGTPVSGAVLANRDLGEIGHKPQAFSTVFLTPERMETARDRLRFGQWRVAGRVFFSDIQLFPALPVYARKGTMELGAGEGITDGIYRYHFNASRRPTNHDRVLAGHDCLYNTNRWVFAPGSHVTYRFGVQGYTQVSATLQLAVSYLSGKGLCVAAGTSQDGPWIDLGRVSEEGTVSFTLPSQLFPAETLFLRLWATSGESDGGQINEIDYQAPLSGGPPDMRGETRYLRCDATDEQLEVTVISLGAPGQSGETVAKLRVNHRGDAPITLRPGVELHFETASAPHLSLTPPIALNPGEQALLDIPYRVIASGETRLRLFLGGDSAWSAQEDSYLSVLHETQYGRLLPSASDAAALWWCSSGWKVGRKRPVPGGPADTAMHVRLARNEREAAQLVVKPPETLKELHISVESPTGATGVRLPSSAVEVLQVGYVPVSQATDSYGEAGEWPDPLLPISGPMQLEGGINHPFWVRVHIDKDVPPGRYQGAIVIEAEAYRARVPLEVEVYPFCLPNQSACVSAFGFDPGLVFRYHGLKTEAEKRQVLEYYLESFANHRISPFNPAPLDPFEVNWPDPETLTAPEELRPSIVWEGWDAAMTRVFEQYHFSSFCLPAIGMGGGTFHDRVVPSLLGYGEESPYYQAAFKHVWHEIQERLRKRGWLEKAYVYWFDEPEPKDYAFVDAGFQRLKRAAPDVRRMITEQVVPELVSGPNIWCPILHEYDHDEADKRRVEGESFWWYICTGPKAPYVTLFIDHPGTALRAWLWQTWQRRIDGILIWQTNYWTSDAAYPDKPQNPYADPMSWMSGYGTPPGTRIPWGNGDGRFIYPPLAAATGNPESPVLERPVDSIRLEMLRDGIEDYDYFSLLAELLESEKGAALDAEEKEEYMRLLDVPAQISTELRHYTFSPDPIEEHRDKLARAIAALL